MTVASADSDEKGVESLVSGSPDFGALLKRTIDLVFSVVLLVPALPLMAISTILVKLSSRGPAIYTQVRVGRNGRTFVIYKIRTMRNDCERLTGPRWAELGDRPCPHTEALVTALAGAVDGLRPERWETRSS